MRILASVAVLIEVVVFCLIQLKIECGRLVRAVRFENEFKQLQEQFQLGKPECSFQKKML